MSTICPNCQTEPSEDYEHADPPDPSCGWRGSPAEATCECDCTKASVARDRDHREYSQDDLEQAAREWWLEQVTEKAADKADRAYDAMRDAAALGGGL